MIQKTDYLKTCKQNYHKDTQNPQLSQNTTLAFNPQQQGSYH